MGTAGQRCTTLRRLFVHANVYDRLVPRLSQVYASVKVGDPRQTGTLVGPLIDRHAFESMQRALQEVREAGGKTHGGERIVDVGSENAFYVRPALCEIPDHIGPVLRETFAPILYVMRCIWSSMKRFGCTTPSGRASLLPSLRSMCARRKDLSRQRVPTAASPT